MQVLVDGHAVAYSDDGQGIPLVLLHAFAADRALWRPQIQALSPRYRVIAMDLRGFGSSGSTNGGAVDVDRHADDVAALLAHLKIRSAVVGGISLGGYVSLAFAQRHPHLLRGLLLANTRAGADTDAARAGRRTLAQSLRQQGSTAVAAFYGDKLFGPTMDEETRRTIRAMLLRQNAQGMISALLGMAQRPDRSNFLGRIGVPTLIVSGTADALIPSTESRYMHDRIRGSVFVDIPDAGHLSNMDKPAAFNRALEQFMGKLA
jgi:pimeloyl-ACP methyl ester carboxylesterase